MSIFPARSVNGDRSQYGRFAIAVLIIVLFISIYCGLIIGAYDVSVIDFIRAIKQNGFDASAKTRDYLVLVNIRPPRIILGGLVGAALAVSGVLMQGLFRNPLADPGIMGVSSGAALGAVMMIVLC